MIDVGLTDEEKRQAIARACGYTVLGVECGIPYGLSPSDDPSGEASPLPDYLNSLEAMHEAEKTLTDEQYVEFNRQLYMMAKGDNSVSDLVAELRRHVSSDARIRADAFLASLPVQQPQSEKI